MKNLRHQKLNLDNLHQLSLTLIFFIIALSCGVLSSHAAVAVDNTSGNGAFDLAGVSTPLNWTHTVGGGISRALVVAVSTSTAIPIPASRVSSVTYSTITQQNLTRIGTTSISPDNLNAVEIFILIAPVSGTGTITVNLLPGVNYVVGGGVSFTGVDQTTPNRTVFNASGSNGLPTVTVSDSLNGDIVLDAVGISPNGGFLVENMSQNLAWNGRPSFSFSFDVGAGSTKPASSPVTTNWIMTGTDLNWAISAVAVKPFQTTAASGTISGRVLTNTGRGLINAIVTMTNSNGEVKTTRSNSFGYYRFTDIGVGETYVFNVRSKQFQFVPQVVHISDDLTDMNFIGQ